MTSDATPPPSAEEPPPGVVPVDVRDYARFSQEAAQRVRVLATPGLVLDLWCVEPQQSTPVLAYPQADLTYTVLGGRSWFVTEEGEVGLDPLGAVLVPRGVHHGIDNRGTDPLIVLASMAPPDELEVAEPVERQLAAVRVEQHGRSRIGRVLGRLLGGER